MELSLYAMLASGGVLALLAGIATIYREACRARRREAMLAAERAELTSAYTELQAAKRRAEAESHHLSATLSGMSDGVMMLNSDFRLVQWNENFPVYAGVPAEILSVGMPMDEMIRAQAVRGEFGPLDDPELREAEVERRMVLVRNHRDTDVTERLRPDGRVLETRRRALPGGGLVTLYTDITARRRAEAAQREVLRLSEAAIEQKSQFVAMVSHEIRVPLNAVTASLALLDQSTLSDQQRLHVDTASQAGDTLLDLINDILDLAKMDAGKLELRPAEFALRPMLQGVCDMFHVQASARGIDVSLEIAPDVPVLLHEDGGRLRQVLMNFVSNAIKFSRAGTVTLRVEMVRRDASPRLRIAVCDQGPRIPPDQATLLYQPFARLDYATEAGVPGTGLGLTICKELARLMGGELGLTAARCDNGAEDGNAFWLELALPSPGRPVAAAPASAASISPPGLAAVLPPRPARRAAVLMVEDVATNRVLTGALLRREGHRVDAAESGSEAIARMASQPFDIVFMDLNMPGMGGCEAARQIRALAGPAGSVPIVALTATDRDTVSARCREAGMNDVLCKPVRPRELFDMLERMVRPVAPLQAASPPAAPASAADADSGLLDAERLLDLQRGLPPGLFASLVEQCLDDIAARMARLHQALTDRETVAVVGIAHALAGMSGSYGMAALDRRMRMIMAASDVGDLETALAAARGMAGELERSAKRVRALLQAQAA